MIDRDIEHAYNCGHAAAEASVYPPINSPFERREFQCAFMLGYDAACAIERFVGTRQAVRQLKERCKGAGNA